MGSNEGMTEYERRRLENIKRNDQMLAAFKIHSRLNDLSAVAASKRQRNQSKSYKRSLMKKPKPESPVVLRRSLRIRGVPSDAATATATATAGSLNDDIDDEKQIKKIPQMHSNSVGRKSPKEQEPLTMSDAYTGDDGLDRKLVETPSYRFLGEAEMGGNERMTEYERRRLENIKRNDEMIAALKINSKLNNLSAVAAAKRQRDQSKSYKRSPVQKPKPESPVVLRRSLRTRRLPSDAATAGGLNDDINDEKQIKKIPQLPFNSVGRKSPREQGPLTMRDADTGDDGLDRKLIETPSYRRLGEAEMGDNERMTEYESRRLENIKRNNEMMAALKINSKINNLSAVATAKRPWDRSKSYKRSPVKKPKPESSVVLCRSLRTRGVPSDAASSGALNDDINDEKQIKNIPQLHSNSVDRKSPREQGSLTMRDAYTGDDGLDRKLIETPSYRRLGEAKMGSNERMTEYERRRLENIKRNDEMMAVLKINSKLNDLSTIAKLRRTQSKSYKRSSVIKPKSESPVVLRQSLRTRGVPPDASTARGLYVYDKKPIKKISHLNSNGKPPWEQGPLTMRDAYTGGDGLDQKFIETFSCLQKLMQDKGDKVPCDNLEKGWDFETFKGRKRLWGAVNVEALQLKSENIQRLVQERITSLKFFPTLDMQMVVVGNKFGGIGFWNVNGKKDDGDGIYLFHPHSGPISGIAIDPFSISKMYTSCYDGFIRLMDVEKEVFDMVYSSEYALYSISLSPHDIKSLYFSEGKGRANMWDVRAGKSLLSCDLHEDRINTIDFNPENENVMATSSKDGTACIWDLRRVNADKPTPLKTVSHKKAVNSAYFSPTGKFLATTSIDDRVGLLSGANYENTSMVYHYNQTDTWISTFKGIWGWDDSSIYIGNMNRGVDVISVPRKKTVATLENGLMSDIPCRFDAHPYNVGMLAGATSGGQVYIWTLMS